jgi:antitoxin component YwqK of YwqJK toxin-antitoxin module
MKLKKLITYSLLFAPSFMMAQKHIQQPQYPDSGFINKAEAKNKMVNGKKEGKWVEQLKKGGDTTKPFYRLVVYKSGKLNGIARYYYANGTEYEEEAYTNGTRNGVTKEFDSRKHLVKETPYINDTINGVVKDFNADGSLKKETLYYKGKEGISKSH